MEPEQTQLNLEQALGILRRRALWMVLCIAVVAGAAFVYSKQKATEYTATSAVAFSANPLSQQIAGLSPTSSSNPVAQQNSNLELVRLGGSAAKTAALLGHGLTPRKVSESVSVGVKGEADVVDVTATSTSPVLAAAIANTYASQFVKEQQAANRAFLKSALAHVRRQLAELPPAERFGSGALDLQERAHTLGFLAEVGFNNAQVAGEALTPTSPSSPKILRNTLLGGILGLLLGLGLAVLLERLDRRIREPEDLQAIYGLPVVGVIPKSRALSRAAPLLAVESEAFSLVRAHIRLFNVDREMRTLMIASAAPGDGKTTIARHLAEAAARSGSRVLLLEVDLRCPTIARELDIRPGPGLADVLVGAVSLGGAIQSVNLRASSSGQGSIDQKIDVLTAGAVQPPNPAELLEGRSMGVLLDHARSSYDLVVIDTPPLSAVSDAFPLLTRVDGVVLVAWVGRSRRDAAERLQSVLVNSGAPLLGVMANGARSGAPEPYLREGRPAAVVAAAEATSPAGEFATAATGVERPFDRT